MLQLFASITTLLLKLVLPANWRANTIASALSSAVDLERCDEAQDVRRRVRCGGGGSRCAGGRVESEDGEIW